jgi:glycogen debranching enzyme
LGQFGEAYLKIAENRDAARQFLLDHLRALVRDHLPAAGIGFVSEIFDGDPPHRPDGCIAQAWSSAELIRLYSLLSERA